MTGRSTQYKRIFLDEGFESVMITDPQLPEMAVHFSDWIDKGYHGNMAWLERNTQVRHNLQELLPGVESIIMVSLNYYSPSSELSGEERERGGAPITISNYARGGDYHRIMKRKLKRCVLRLKSDNPDIHCRICVDTAPLFEKVWGMKAGLGFIGKNGCLIQRDNGSYFFIGAVLVNERLAVDLPESEHCGNCSRCIESCPTGALVAPYILDARRCISYLTIEHKGSFNDDTELAGSLFGCDICQSVCPWNRKSRICQTTEFHPKIDKTHLSLVELERMDSQLFKSWVKNSPMDRMSFENFQRNLKHLKMTHPVNSEE